MSTESKHNSIEIIQPDDMHVHFRDGDVLKDVVPHTAAQFAIYCGRVHGGLQPG